MYCGAVGCGVVWCGVVWCDVVWCGVICAVPCFAKCYAVVCCVVVWSGVVWCAVVSVDLIALGQYNEAHHLNSLQQCNRIAPASQTALRGPQSIQYTA